MYIRCARCAPVPAITNTRPTFRPTTASFSPATLSPTLPCSANDLPLLREGARDAEREVQVHPQGFCYVCHVRRPPTLQVPQDRGPRLRLCPRPHDDDSGFPEFVHVGFKGSLDELSTRAHSRPSHELIDFL